MSGVRVWGLAFVCAVALATLLLPSGGDGDRAGPAPLWERSLFDLSRLAYESGDRRLAVSWEEIGGERRLIAVEEGRSGRRRYPLGTAGREAVARLTALRPVRDLGPFEGEPSEIGIGAGRITLTFEDRAWELRLGGEVPAGEERYALVRRRVPSETAGEAVGRRLVAVEGSELEPFELGEGALRVRRLHDFTEAAVAGVTVAVGGAEAVLTRSLDGSWEVEGAVAEAALRLVERSRQLALLGFPPPPPPDELRSLASLRYLDGSGAELGRLELSRAGGSEYWIESERTAFPALADPTLARRVEEALLGLF